MFSRLPFSKISLSIWALIGLMLATRFHHFGSAISLPDASLAVFFMAGLWFGGRRLLVGLLIEAALIDYVAINYFSVRDYCISPAYIFLIPTYAALFYAGHLAARFKTLQAHDLLLQLGLLVGATSVAFLISNTSFYVLSDRFGDLSWAQYFGRVAHYFQPYLSSTLVYSVVIIGAVRLINAWLPNHQNKAI